MVCPQIIHILSGNQIDALVPIAQHIRKLGKLRNLFIRDTREKLFQFFIFHRQNFDINFCNSNNHIIFCSGMDIN